MSHQSLLLSSVLAALLLGFTCETSQAVVRPAAANEVATLRQAYAALDVADHDYQGHRRQAMDAIEKACKALGSEVRGDGKGHEPQGESDAQLRKAKQLLEGIGGGVRGHASKHLHRAMKELNIALSIK